MKKIFNYFKLKKEIKKSKKAIETINKELDFYYSFEVVETNSWYDAVYELRHLLSEEKKKLSGLEKEKGLVFAK